MPHAGLATRTKRNVLSWLISRADQPHSESGWARYGSALLAVAIATLARWAMDPYLGSVAPHGCYVAATVYIAWRRGLGPALLCVFLGAICATYFFVPPRYTLFTITGVENQINLIFSVFLGVSMALVSESLRLAATENARLYREAKDEDHRKDEFLAMLAHELRNPLVPIRNAIYVLETKGSKEPEVVAMQDLMARQVDHLIRLVDDLLDVSRMSRGIIGLRRELLTGSEVISSALEIARPLMDSKQQQLEVSLPPPDVRLYADRIRLTQALANLLNNASRYTPAGGNISLVCGTEEEDMLTVRVRDNGIGIEPAMVGRIFKLFEQAHASPGKYGGLGIGLTLAQRLVTMHGGTIEAHSAGLDKGSEFVVRLPLVRETQMYERPAMGRPARAKSQLPHRVLVIDDSVPTAQSMARVLTLWKHDVRVCHDIASALQVAKEFQPDVVLSDIGLPESDGYQLARQIRQLPGMTKARLIAITGHGQPEDRRRAREAGFDEYLLKPVNPDTLADIFAS